MYNDRKNKIRWKHIWKSHLHRDTRAHLRISLTTWNKWNTVDTVNENQL